MSRKSPSTSTSEIWFLKPPEGAIVFPDGSPKIPAIFWPSRSMLRDPPVRSTSFDLHKLTKNTSLSAGSNDTPSTVIERPVLSLMRSWYFLFPKLKSEDIISILPETSLQMPEAFQIRAKSLMIQLISCSLIKGEVLLHTWCILSYGWIKVLSLN